MERKKQTNTEESKTALKWRWLLDRRALTRQCQGTCNQSANQMLSQQQDTLCQQQERRSTWYEDIKCVKWLGNECFSATKLHNKEIWSEKQCLLLKDECWTGGRKETASWITAPLLGIHVDWNFDKIFYELFFLFSKAAAMWVRPPTLLLHAGISFVFCALVCSTRTQPCFREPVCRVLTHWPHNVWCLNLKC